MTTSSKGRRGALSASLALVALVALPSASPATATPKAKPKKKVVVSTGAATHILDTSALLNASINPNGNQTSYYFQWGTTTSYGSQTPTVVVGADTTRVKVGQSISGLQAGVTYHYRVVAVVSGEAPVLGRDRTLFTGKSTPKLEIPRNVDVVVGTPFVVSGTLTGPNNTHQTVELQGSTYPYREAFMALGPTTVTGPTGQFFFAVSPIAANTQLRAITVGGLRPLYSRTEIVHAQAKVVLRVRTSRTRGLVRLYGTVTPAAVGAKVLLQVHEAVKPGVGKPGAEVTARFVDQFTTVVKKAGKSFSRFSVVVNVRVGGRYRAVVQLRNGAVVTGYSPTVVLKAGPSKKKKKATAKT
jgi:hypothetical protein